jgi:ferrous iron transport protein B
MKQEGHVRIALVGQPNCGKSTVFNALTGARRHVANWPGVTVDKVSGRFFLDGRMVEVLDLPGTYSLTSFSPEERVTRDFLLQENPFLVVNVIDAANLGQGLALTVQLLEMGIRPLINLNMMDVARKQGLVIDAPALERLLQVAVVATSMKSRRDAKTLKEAISRRLDTPAPLKTFNIHYGPMEVDVREIEKRIAFTLTDRAKYPTRRLAVELMKGDHSVEELVGTTNMRDRGLPDFVREKRKSFETESGETPEMHIAQTRNAVADGMAGYCVRPSDRIGVPVSERIDRVVCNRFAGPLIFLAVMYMLYYLSIVQGYKLTAYTWPLLAGFRALMEAVTPSPGFIEIPLLRAFALWFTDSVNALLNYLPIFFILFALIAVLEDSGYMPRMAFIMDRVLRRFGLHGRSVLPLALGGAYVGGCAVPAVMSCKGIPDERSRLATILTVPMLNCQAKVPLYILLINACFTHNKGFAMFFISTVSLLLVLPVAKLLTLTVLKDRETAPFVMEMPPYHLPTLRVVLGKAMERLWLYLRKITTVVAAVSVVIFVLLRFPGLSAERRAVYEGEKDRLMETFRRGTAGTPYGDSSDVMPLILYWNDYKSARMTVGGKSAAASVERRFQARNPDYYRIVRPGNDPSAVKVNRALRNLARDREQLLVRMKRESLEDSLLGRLGKVLESATSPAGFDWRVNVALLSALAAKENTVATLGAIYEQDGGGGSLETRIAAGHAGPTPLHALALMLFMVLYPPCVATAIAVKVQTGSMKWMLFSIAYPILLGFAAAVLVFSCGRALGLTGIQAMGAFWLLALCFTVAAGFLRYAPGSAGNSERITGQKESLVRGEA